MDKMHRAGFYPAGKPIQILKSWFFLPGKLKDENNRGAMSSRPKPHVGGGVEQELPSRGGTGFFPGDLCLNCPPTLSDLQSWIVSTAPSGDLLETG